MTGVQTCALPISAGATLSAFPWQVLAQAEGWKSYEVVTRVEILKPRGTSLAWVPVPGVDGPWQKSVGSSWSGNAARATLVSDGKYGAEMLYFETAETGKVPAVRVTSRFATRDRAVDLSKPGTPGKADRAELQKYLAPTDLIPTDGIVQIGRAHV